MHSRRESDVNSAETKRRWPYGLECDDLRPRRRGITELDVTRSRSVPKSSAAGTADTWVSARDTDLIPVFREDTFCCSQLIGTVSTVTAINKSFRLHERDMFVFAKTGSRCALIML